MTDKHINKLRKALKALIDVHYETRNRELLHIASLLQAFVIDIETKRYKEVQSGLSD